MRRRMSTTINSAAPWWTRCQVGLSNPVCLLQLAILALISSSHACLAGENAGGRAYLSWAKDASVQATPAFAASSRALYVHIEGVRRVTQLALAMEYSAGTLPNECLVLSTSPTADSTIMGSQPTGETTFDGLPFGACVLGSQNASEYVVEYQASVGLCELTSAAIRL